MKIQNFVLLGLVFVSSSALNAAQQHVAHQIAQSKITAPMDTSEIWEKQAKSSAALQEQELKEYKGLTEAFASISIQTPSKGIITAAAIRDDANELVIGTLSGQIIRYHVSGHIVGEYSCQGAIIALCVTQKHIAAATALQGLHIISTGTDPEQFVFETEAPAKQIVNGLMEESFFVLDSEGYLEHFSYNPKKNAYDSAGRVPASIVQGGSTIIPDANHSLAVTRKGNDVLIESSEPKKIFQHVSSREPIRAFGVSPDGSLLVTAVGQEKIYGTVWYTKRAPLSFMLSKVPEEIVIDRNNRFVVAYRPGGSDVEICDLASSSSTTQKQSRTLFFAQQKVTQAFFSPSDSVSFIVVTQTHDGKSQLSLHPSETFTPTQEQNSVLAAIEHEKERQGKDYKGYRLTQEQKQVLSTVHPWIRRVLRVRFQVYV